MLILWMIYATSFAAIAAGVAVALDRVASVWNAPRRFVWAIAALVSIVVPTALAVRPSVSPASVEVMRTLIDMRGMTRTASAPANERPMMASAPSVAPAEWNRAAIALWCAASIVLAALLFRSFRTLRRHRRQWRASAIDGREVLITSDAGPAVVGALRPRIILPEWALALPRDEQMLMLTHESEHIRARDPAMLLAVAIALVLVPWNAALWYIVHRLRLAVELDCDQRVLARDDRTQQYGMLLLSVGARRGLSLPLMTALAERHPFLERRILAMTALRSNRPVLASAPFAAIAIVAVTVAAQTPRPASLVPASVAAPTPTREVHLVPTPAVASVPVASAPVTKVLVPTMVDDAVASDRVQSIQVATPGSVLSAGVDSVRRKWTATYTPTLGEVPLDSIMVWVLRQYPSVANGDTSISVVSILIDSNERYVRSTAGRNAGSPSMLLGGISPDNIASVEVIKGGAAQAMYGDAAANGVITVRTKPGSTVDSVRAGSRIAWRKAQGIDLTEPQGSPLIVIDGAVQTTTSMAGLNVAAADIQSVELTTLRAGLVGPNEIHVVLAKLKN